jgi:voltage-gated potassium channel
MVREDAGPAAAMGERRVDGLPAMAPRRLVLRALLRALLTATVLTVLYFTLPFDGALDSSAALLLVVGLLVFSGVIAWQVRSVLRSDYPGLRAIEALAAAIPLFLLVFAVAYFKLTGDQPGAFSEPLSRLDSLYYTVTVFSTVGFGDITPKADVARIVTMVQMLGDLLVVGLILRVMFSAVKAGLERRAAATGAGGGATERGTPVQRS